MLGVTKEDASSGSVLPFAFAADGALERGIKDEDRATEGVLMFPKQVVLHFVFGELGEGRNTIWIGSDIVPDVDSMMECVGPEACGNRLGPSV